MPPIHVVLARHDPAQSDSLVRLIQQQFLNLATVNSAEEARNAIARTRASLAVVDLEVVGLSQLGELCREFPATAFVCIHRLADDDMWSRSLAASPATCRASFTPRNATLRSKPRTPVLLHDPVFAGAAAAPA